MTKMRDGATQTELTKLPIMKFSLIALLAVFLFFPVVARASDVVPETPFAEDIVNKVRPKLIKELSNKGLELGSPVFIRIFKESKELEVWVKGDVHFELFRTYKICRFSGDLGPKTRQGDMQSPEGFYIVKPDQLNPNSKWHLAFNLGYPNKLEQEQGRTGGSLMVHGNCGSHGCYAMTDEKIEEIYTLVEATLKSGQPYFQVHAFPFRMTEKKLSKHRTSEWYTFWENLKEGYDYFETRRYPPTIFVDNNRYVFY